jgi:hypothetical protein
LISKFATSVPRNDANFGIGALARILCTLSQAATRMTERLTSGNHGGSLRGVADPMQRDSHFHSAASRSAPPQLDP